MRKKLTLKQRRFLEELPTAKSYGDAALKAGYSPNTAHNARVNIVEKRATQRHFDSKTRWTPESIMADIDRGATLAEKGNDLTNLARFLDMKARIKAMFITRQEITAHITHSEAENTDLERLRGDITSLLPVACSN